MAEAPVVIRALGRPGDLGWVVMAHGEVYAAEFGWDASFEALVAQIVADFTRTPEATRSRVAAWVAEVDGHRAGCVFCVDDGDGAARLRILLVHPSARGHGLGARLVDECLAFARARGYRSVRLWTNDPLVAARHLYVARGFVLTDETPHHSYGVDLVGQNYELAF